MEEKILSILRQVLEVGDIDATCSQESCAAWDSLRHLNLVVELEETFDVSIEPNEFSMMKNVSDIVRLLKSKGR